MKRVFCFCIPAHGHTNPMTAVTRALVSRGNQVRFYSFREFEEKIRATGAEFIACDEYLPELTAEQKDNLMKVSTTEMTLQDIRSTAAMDSFLNAEFERYKPDVIFTDSVCFWGKLNAWKHQVPMVVSTSTFAFNSLSSGYMKHSFAEIRDIIGGMPKISRELKTLEPYGYHVKSAISLVQSDNDTDSVVYTSRAYQPYGESFSGHYAFVDPSVMTDRLPDKTKQRPLVYISLGTVINDRPDFYTRCIEALRETDADVLISCGRAMDPARLGTLPDNVKVCPYVDQLEVLSRADAFITHCGMNSVSESLYMATPMVLYPQTGEQEAVARRAREIGAGVTLKDDSAAGIRAAVETVLHDPSYAKAAMACSEDFRACSGAEGAAEFIENAPHHTDDRGVLNAVRAGSGLFRLVFWLVMTPLLILLGIHAGWTYAILLSVAANILAPKLTTLFTEKLYGRLAEKHRQRRD